MTKTLQQIYDEIKAPERCSKTMICKALTMALNFSDTRRGLVASLIVNVSTGKSTRQICYFGGDFKKGMRLNYCPFCGKKAPVMLDPKPGDVVAKIG